MSFAITICNVAAAVTPNAFSGTERQHPQNYVLHGVPPLRANTFAGTERHPRDYFLQDATSPSNHVLMDGASSPSKHGLRDGASPRSQGRTSRCPLYHSQMNVNASRATSSTAPGVGNRTITNGHTKDQTTGAMRVQHAPCGIQSTGERGREATPPGRRTLRRGRPSRGRETGAACAPRPTAPTILQTPRKARVLGRPDRA